jgi:hypothetical protein
MALPALYCNGTRISPPPPTGSNIIEIMEIIQETGPNGMMTPHAGR